MPNFYSTNEFESRYTYTGTDLGAVWSAEKTAFRVWAPTAEAVTLCLYKSGTPGTKDLIEKIDMTADVNGTWVACKGGDLNGVYYTYLVTVDGKTVEACDPYARTTGVNGQRAMVIDLASTNPEGWTEDCDPNAGKAITDAVIYELHVRDLSADESSGIVNKGKFLGVIEKGTKTKSGIPTGLDHIKSLGVTHVHILPMYDYGFTDEILPLPQYNWGYDPVNFNVPEGSYATDPYNGAVRVKEAKQMIKGLHDAGLSVVMDVVYNHVYEAYDFCFNKIVPMYFSRFDKNGTLINTSGCGNDTASERNMVRKYIVDSVKYLADEYHIDGFRFDLVGLIDTDTINELVAEVHMTHPNVIFYGEGWDMATGITKPDVHMTVQRNAHMVPGFAFFNDTIRNQVKGSVFDNTEKGFVSGGHFNRGEMIKAFRGQTDWAPNPTQTVNYASCHDNNTLIDRIVLSTREYSRADQIKMNDLAAAFCMLSQGVPFFHAGEEMLRTKPAADGGFDHNSYRAPDSVNAFKWNDLDKDEYARTLAFYKGLVAFRQAHPALRLTTKDAVDAVVTTLDCGDTRVLCFLVDGNVPGESAKEIYLAFNGNSNDVKITLPKGQWSICIWGDEAGTEILGTASGDVTVPALSAMVLVKQKSLLKPVLVGAAAVGAAMGIVRALTKSKK